MSAILPFLCGLTIGAWLMSILHQAMIKKTLDAALSAMSDTNSILRNSVIMPRTIKFEYEEPRHAADK